MNEKLLAILQGDTRSYPYELEKLYPRILNKIIEVWYTPQAEEFFLDLMVDKRGGRQGFPPKVAAEIFRLGQMSERPITAQKPDTNKAWELVGVRELQLRDTQVAED